MSDDNLFATVFVATLVGVFVLFAVDRIARAYCVAHVDTVELARECRR